MHHGKYLFFSSGGSAQGRERAAITDAREPTGCRGAGL
ncbi:Unknown protein sequence [Pseudomonas coronafaciens pv. oryzae]|nr:Unknown protein sequence [Pseudomonas coronafaciens pv. oryzae]